MSRNTMCSLTEQHRIKTKPTGGRESPHYHTHTTTVKDTLSTSAYCRVSQSYKKPYVYKRVVKQKLHVLQLNMTLPLSRTTSQ